MFFNLGFEKIIPESGIKTTSDHTAVIAKRKANFINTKSRIAENRRIRGINIIEKITRYKVINKKKDERETTKV